MSEQSAIVMGREIVLPSGAKVFGALHERSVVWKFTSTSCAVTDITLSREAMTAMVQIFQGIIGCDTDLVRVGIEVRESGLSQTDRRYVCSSESCPWAGPASEAVSPQHDSVRLMCPLCHEVLELEDTE